MISDDSTAKALDNAASHTERQQSYDSLRQIIEEEGRAHLFTPSEEEGALYRKLFHSEDDDSIIEKHRHLAVDVNAELEEIIESTDDVEEAGEKIKRIKREVVQGFNPLPGTYRMIFVVEPNQDDQEGIEATYKDAIDEGSVYLVPFLARDKEDIYVDEFEREKKKEDDNDDGEKSCVVEEEPEGSSYRLIQTSCVEVQEEKSATDLEEQHKEQPEEDELERRVDVKPLGVKLSKGYRHYLTEKGMEEIKRFPNYVVGGAVQLEFRVDEEGIAHTRVAGQDLVRIDPGKVYAFTVRPEEVQDMDKLFYDVGLHVILKPNLPQRQKERFFQKGQATPAYKRAVEPLVNAYAGVVKHAYGCVEQQAGGKIKKGKVAFAFRFDDHGHMRIDYRTKDLEVDPEQLDKDHPAHQVMQVLKGGKKEE